MEIKTINPENGESGPASLLSYQAPGRYISLAVARAMEEDAPHVLVGENLDSTVLGEKVIRVAVASGGILIAESVLGTQPPKEE